MRGFGLLRGAAFCAGRTTRVGRRMTYALLPALAADVIVAVQLVRLVWWSRDTMRWVL